MEKKKKLHSSLKVKQKFTNSAIDVILLFMCLFLKKQILH